MGRTISDFNRISNRLAVALARTAKEPTVERETEYYLANIGNKKSLDDFLKDDRIYRFAMKAFGLEEMTYAKAFMRKVITEGIDSRSSFANKLADNRYREFAEAFNFARYGATTTTFTRTQQGTVDRYVRQTLESDAGVQNEGVRLALYFQRKAPGVTSAYGVLADRAMLKVVQVITGLPDGMSTLDIDKQAEMIRSKLDVADFKDPSKLSRMLVRFAAKWDLVQPATLSVAVPIVAGTGGSVAIDTATLAAIQTLKQVR